MSADNQIAIFKVDKKYYGIMVFMSDDCCYVRPSMRTLRKKKLFIADSAEEAIEMANKELGNDIYEYGYMFV